MTETSDAIVYQLKVVLVGISPMIWRRLQVNGDSTIADLHYILQIAMGWCDEHLNQFTIHGKRYGVYHSGGLSFSDDPTQVRLADFRFREREKFLYEYDFIDCWRHQLRVEAIHYRERPLSCPVCLAGKRAAPPEDCGGVLAFLAKRQRYSIGYALELLSDIRDGGAQTLADRYDEVCLLLQWLSLENFDCNTVNRRLQAWFKNRGFWVTLA